MKTSRIDYINIGLMVVSMIAAIKLPFELFLLAYAVLGPLHYLTEIGWLHKRNYFSKGKSDWLLLTFFCALEFIALMFYEAKKYPVTAGWVETLQNSNFSFIYHVFTEKDTIFIFMAFATAFATVIFSNSLYRYLFILFCLIPAIYVNKIPTLAILFGVFLPTIIHVCIFTGLFMLFGAMKSRSTSGYLSVLAFVLCILFIFNIKIDPKSYKVGEYWINSLIDSNFNALNYRIWEVIAPNSKAQFMLNSATGIKIQAFIAFAYTYHYLNWFSKTEVIKWHQVQKKWLVTTAVIWIASVSLYFYNYRTGLIALFFLSVLHVFLEFPLNFQSIIGIGKEGLKIAGRKTAEV
jgi:hypothetical protein